MNLFKVVAFSVAFFTCALAEHVASNATPKTTDEEFRRISQENHELKMQMNKMMALLTETIETVDRLKGDVSECKDGLSSLQNRDKISKADSLDVDDQLQSGFSPKNSLGDGFIRLSTSPIQKRLAPGIGPVVAFSVSIDVPNENLAIGQTVKFDNVHTNVGGAFLATTSTFRVPESGLYHFDLIIMSYKGEDIQTELVKDGTEIVRLHSGDPSSFGVGVQSIILYLNAGSSVWVRVVDNPAVNDGNIRIFGLNWSSFSGFLIV